ncbi:hypothetical protein SLS62_003028 [Diatrype stigma]|uniref:Protein kinase domain-containing protein n=1 Tax=Diatrype stigma TaxID=117547 RepID=A0AAN9UT27_9PEZI
MSRRRLRPKASTNPYERRKKTLQSYFEGDSQSRFHLEDRHDQGGQASVYRVKYVTPGRGGSIPKLLVLKLANPDSGSDIAGVRRERDVLRRLNGCKHIARIREFAGDDPLNAADALGWAWIYLDALENGTLTDFMRRAKSAGIQSLPDRLLWRIFMCSMSWPQKTPNENETTTGKLGQPSGITHNDVHGLNFMFGPYMDSPEHDITPILKLIDFGQSEVWFGNKRPDNSGVTAEQWNVEDIGLMMATVITLQTDTRYTGQEIEVDLSMLPGHSRPTDVLSPASGILPDPDVDPRDPCPRVNRNLRVIVAACIASDPAQRPTLAELETWVYGQVRRSSPGGGAGDAANNDQSIRALVKACAIDGDAVGDVPMGGT